MGSSGLGPTFRPQHLMWNGTTGQWRLCGLASFRRSRSKRGLPYRDSEIEQEYLNPVRTFFVFRKCQIWQVKDMTAQNLSLVVCLGLLGISSGQELPVVESTEPQPVSLLAKRFIEALGYVGGPLPESTARAFADSAEKSGDERVSGIQSALDPLCLAMVTINPESRVSVIPGPAKAELVVGDWRIFPIKVHNEAGVTAPLNVTSAQSVADGAQPTENRWIQLEFFRDRPLQPPLSGRDVEYRLLMIRAGESGKRSAVLQFDVGQGTQDLGFRADLMVHFDIPDVHPITLALRDENGEPTTASLEIRDALGRTYPSQPKRTAPDFRFHPQVYRNFGEILSLPPGDYDVVCRRGPEYLEHRQTLMVGEAGTILEVDLERWIDPSKFGWWSGDHHIHAAGCKHYINPTLGVHSGDMALHCRGEDLKIGANLTWGPCFDYQKQFFTGQEDKASRYPYLLRYDIEVSGFGSHRSGHLCLLRLRDQVYPGGESKEHWPTLCLNTLKWAQKQGAVCGPAHSGWGLAVKSEALPNYEIPPFDGIGANEYIVDVTHEVEGPRGTTVPAVDFLSMVDTPYVWELNIWYHTLNVGYRTRISGETDFPCIYGDRVGLGRSYIKLDGALRYDAWCQGISEGRGYVSDGLSHLIDFAINGQEVGTNGSEINLENPGTITISSKVGARLEPEPETLPNIPHARLLRDKPEIAEQLYVHKPFWHLERARIANSRHVKVEVVVNGKAIASQNLEADGTLQDIDFNVGIEKSSWVALRILPSSHTNPIFVKVDNQPIRASKKSAEWCLASVEQCWKQKEKFLADSEMQSARDAYDHARRTYRNLIRESVE